MLQSSTGECKVTVQATKGRTHRLPIASEEKWAPVSQCIQLEDLSFRKDFNIYTSPDHDPHPGKWAGS